MPERITGKYLNELWGIGSKHTLYSHDGSWYHQLTRFPEGSTKGQVNSMLRIELNLSHRVLALAP